MYTPITNPITRACLTASAARNSRWFAGIVAGTTLLGAASVQAGDNLWTGLTDNNYNTASNWSLSRVPISPNGDPEPDNGDDAVINDVSLTFPIITADLAAQPRDIIVGNLPGSNGRLDHRAGVAMTGASNWMLVGREGGTGVYNLANTAAAGGALTGFAQGSGSLNVGYRLYVGGTGAGGTGTANVNTTGTVTIPNDMQIGVNGSAGTLNMDSGTINVGGWSIFGNSAAGNGTLKLGGGSLSTSGNFVAGDGGTSSVQHTGGTNAVNGELWVGQGAGSLGTYTVGTGATVTINSWVAIGRNGGNGTVNVNGGSLTKTGGGNFIVADAGTDEITTGLVAQTGGAVSTGESEFWLANNAKATGTYTISNGTLSVGNWLAVGRGGKGTLTQTGGTVTKTGGGSVSIGNFDGAGAGTANVSGGLFDVQTGDLFVGEGGNGSGTLNLSASGQVNAPLVRIGTGGTVVGTLNLDGGTLRTGLIDGAGDGSSTVHFNGTQIIATANNDGFVGNLDSATVKAGGLKIDTNGNVVGINSALIADGAGGVTKTGFGTLNLNGANTYTGATTVSDGSLGGTGTIAGAVSITGTADLNPGVTTGTLTAASVSFSSTSSLTIDINDADAIPGDTLAVTGNLNLNNTTLAIFGTPTLPVYVIATYGSLTGSFAAPLLPDGYTLNYHYNGNQIALVGSGSTPYTTWTTTYFPGQTSQAIIGPDADPDGDGNSNRFEFALGGNPNSATDRAKVYPIVADGSDTGTANELLLTIAVRSGTPVFTGSPSPTATKDGFTYTVQGSTNLSTFATAVTVDTPYITGLPTVPAGYEYRTFSLSGSDGVPSKGFLRVLVTP